MTDSAADPRWWDDRVFCMIGPDCLRRLALRAVLDALREADLVPAGWWCTEVAQPRIDAVSQAQNAGPGQVYRYRAMDALFGLGPVLLLVLRDRAGRGTDELYRTAARVKGDADPRRAEPGTIRHDIGSVNVVMSLLHLSDSPRHSAAEAALLGDGVEPHDYLPAEELGTFVTTLEATQDAEHRLFSDVLKGLRGRLVARLWSDLSPEGRRLAAKLTADGGLADAEAGRLLAREAAGVRHGRLPEILGLPFDSSEPPPDMQRVAGLLRLHRLGLDSWETAVLTTSSYFSPMR
ncbi:nucleoside-diphosphate kinase [Actinomadura rubrisoli]|uniref:Nucleoside diphosphate kinase-like domain-containing protein n=1 Tax=Actinomadura rubrisoli TaxID=2530368 RepID=A0A4R5BMB7_9ACTN|nr:nucleoside-diphosphate kinase [Actinomadura rubrisoli]TDD85024.1 hypothetical protein E1298_19125 [Actinomadura rubrisoli]